MQSVGRSRTSALLGLTGRACYISFIPGRKGAKDPLRVTSPLTAVVPEGVLTWVGSALGAGRWKLPLRVVSRVIGARGSAQRDSPLSLEARPAWRTKQCRLQHAPRGDGVYA